MNTYPLPPNLSRVEFHGLVTDLYYHLQSRGLDPAAHLIIQDNDEQLPDGTSAPRLAIFISEDAAQILLKEPLIFTDALSGKILIDEAALASWLTEEIRKHSGCEQCTVLNVYKLSQLVDGEPNWSIGVFWSENPDSQACQCALDHVKHVAAERFDLV